MTKSGADEIVTVLPFSSLLFREKTLGHVLYIFYPLLVLCYLELTLHSFYTAFFASFSSLLFREHNIVAVPVVKYF